jgi:hypothetical protein
MLTGSCRVREYTGDGYYVGPCEHATHDYVCPRHGDVGAYIMDNYYNESGAAAWPADYQLPKWDGNPWAERLRARQDARVKRYKEI